MKQTLLIITFLLSGYLQNFAQNYETFVTEMKKLEQEEKEYSGILFRKNDYSAEYKKGFEPKLKKVREEKVTLAVRPSKPIPTTNALSTYSTSISSTISPLKNSTACSTALPLMPASIPCGKV